MLKEERTHGQVDFLFAATGIGSDPSLDIQRACRRILQSCPQIPFWPQFVRRSPLEGMETQFSEGLPLLEKREGRPNLFLRSGDTESELVAFYESYLADDVGRFAVSRDYAPGLYELVSLIRQDPEKCGPYIKGQIVGPLTFAASIKNAEGRSLLHHPDLLEATAKALAMKALWQVRQLGTSGKKTILFLDEPYLSGYGSAFCAIGRETVIGTIREVVDDLRQKSDALIGIHICGNTDWPMIFATGPDIVSFDAFSFMDPFLLYPEEITRFIQGGGSIAWGIVPTLQWTGKETMEGLLSLLEKGLTRLREWGLDSELVAGHSLLSPACGMGTMNERDAQSVLDLLSRLSRRCRDLC